MPRTNFVAESGSSARSPRFHNVGDTFVGLLLKPPTAQQKTVYGTGELATYSNGDPIMEYLYEFKLVKESTHPDGCHYCKKMNKRDDEDNGSRRLYAKPKLHKQIQNAFRSTKDLELYGPLVVKYASDDDANKKPGYDAPKVYQVAYRNPTDEEVTEAETFLGVGATPAEDDGEKMSMEDLINFA